MLWRWRLLFVAVVLIAPLVAYLLVRDKPKVYQSSTLISVSGATVTTPGNTSGSFSTTNLQAIARLVNTSQIANIAAKLLNPPADPGSVAGDVSASADVATNFITITAQAHNPNRAAATANAFASALGTNRTNAAIGELNNQITTLQRQLAATPIGPANALARQQLLQQISQLQALRGSQGGNVSVIEQAKPNPTVVSPHIRRTVELGFVIGLLLAIGAVALAENSDRRMRNPADLEEMTKLPLLAAIPSHAFAAPLDSVDGDEEAFQMLRAALTYFNVDRQLRTVVVTSAGQKDGKTTVAIRLALATARAGKHVLLVDADLRRAQVTERLRLNASAGLGDVLAGEIPLSSVLLDYRVQAAKGGSLQILPAGPAPPNPSELLSSQEMMRLMGELERNADVVIIDTPAALAVSDTMPLLQSASGVILVARLNKSTRDAVRRLQRVIASVNGTILGAVATASGPGPGYEGYTYGYASQQGNAKGPVALLKRLRRAPSSPPEKPLDELITSPSEFRNR